MSRKQVEQILDLTGHKIVNVGAPTNPTDAARLADIPSLPSLYGFGLHEIPVGNANGWLTSEPQLTYNTGQLQVTRALDTQTAGEVGTVATHPDEIPDETVVGQVAFRVPSLDGQSAEEHNPLYGAVKCVKTFADGESGGVETSLDLHTQNASGDECILRAIAGSLIPAVDESGSLGYTDHRFDSVFARVGNFSGDVTMDSLSLNDRGLIYFPTDDDLDLPVDDFVGGNGNPLVDNDRVGPWLRYTTEGSGGSATFETSNSYRPGVLNVICGSASTSCTSVVTTSAVAVTAPSGSEELHLDVDLLIPNDTGETWDNFRFLMGFGWENYGGLLPHAVFGFQVGLNSSRWFTETADGTTRVLTDLGSPHNGVNSSRGYWFRIYLKLTTTQFVALWYGGGPGGSGSIFAETNLPPSPNIMSCSPGGMFRTAANATTNAFLLDRAKLYTKNSPARATAET